MKKVGIILINYKNYAERFLRESYDSLMALDYPKEDYRVYVVDNVTSEETVNMIKALAPEATVVPSAGNGWGHANNVGAKQAIKDGFADYLYIVNMDTIFDPECLKEAVAAAESDSRIGIVQSKLLLHPAKDGEYCLNSKGNSITFLGFGYCAGDGKKDDAGDDVTDIVTAAGAGLLIPRKVFEAVGGCDESYFMYHDDIELSFKVKLMGLRLVLAPRSVVYHKHEFGRAVMQIFHMERNRLRFIIEFYKLGTILLILPAWLFMEIGMIPFELMNKWFSVKLRVYAYFLKPENWRMMLRKRKFLQGIRKIKDREMMEGMVGVVEFQQIDNPVLRYIANPIFDAYWKIARRLIVW